MNLSYLNATSGRLASQLESCLPHILRPGRCVTVELASGYLQSETFANMIAGANRAALQHPDGAWELIGFCGAKLVGPKQYELSGILRGIGGSDYSALRQIPVGSTFVLFDDAILSLSTDLSQLNQRSLWRVGLASQDYSSSSFKQVETILQGSSLFPLSPVQASAKRIDGSKQINFIRRSRSPYDIWDMNDVPLGEDIEDYEIDIFKAGSRIRTLKSNQPVFQYPRNFELDDFGQPQVTLNVKIYQMSALLGRGFPAVQSLSIM